MIAKIEFEDQEDVIESKSMLEVKLNGTQKDIDETEKTIRALFNDVSNHKDKLESNYHFPASVFLDLKVICKSTFDVDIQQHRPQPWLPNSLIISGIRCTEAKIWLL